MCYSDQVITCATGYYQRTPDMLMDKTKHTINGQDKHKTPITKMLLLPEL